MPGNMIWKIERISSWIYLIVMKPSLFFLSLILLTALTACNMTSPEKYFDVTVLNSNTITQFGGKEIYDWLHENPQTYNAQTKQMAPSSYVDCVKFKFSFAEKALQDIQALPVTEEAKPMIEASKDLFGFAVDKEKTGYVSIAALKESTIEFVEAA